MTWKLYFLEFNVNIKLRMFTKTYMYGIFFRITYDSKELKQLKCPKIGGCYINWYTYGILCNLKLYFENYSMKWEIFHNIIVKEKPKILLLCMSP